MRSMRARVGYLVSAVLVTACPDETGPSVSIVNPEVELPQTLDFGEIPLGTERSLEIVFRNTGDGVLRVEALELDPGADGPDFKFEVDSAGFDVRPGTSRAVSVRFFPLAPQEQSEQSGLTVRSNLPEPVYIELVGRGVASRVQVTPDPIDFGAVLWGSEREIEVAVTNLHDVPAGLFVRLDDTGRPRVETIDGPGRFELLSRVDQARGGALLADGAELEPQQSFTTRLRYVATPGEERRLDQGRWWISTCAPAVCAVAAPLRASPRSHAFECTPAPIDFGRVEPDERVVVTSTCTNVVTEPVDLLGVDLERGPEGYELVDVPEVTRLEPGEAISFGVAFSPPDFAVGRTLERRVLVRHRRAADFSDELQTVVDLSGTAGRPRLEVTPGTMHFSTTAVGTRARRTLRLANTGQGSLSISQLTVTGPFEVDEQSLSVPQRSVQDIEVRFFPLTAGPHSGDIVIESSDPRRPRVIVPLVADAVLVPPCRADVGPDPVVLGAVEVGQRRAGAIEIRNEGGGDCLLNDIRLTGASTAAFRLDDARLTGRVVPAGTSTVVNVSLRPTAAQAYSTTLEMYLSSSDGERTQVTVSGQGVVGGLVISPAPIEVGPSRAACAPDPSPLWIINPSQSTVTVSAVSVDDAIYEISGLPNPFPPGGVPLAPGGSVALQVGLRPDTVGPARSSLRVEVDAQAAPYLVPVRRIEAPDERRVVRFERGPRALDVLFVVADNAAFSQEQADLPQIGDTFVRALERAGIDFRIGVLRALATDPSCPVPPVAERPASATTWQGACGYLADGGSVVGSDPDWRVVHPGSAPSARGVLSGTLVQTLRPGFQPLQMVEATWRALSAPVVTGWNADLFRPDAALLVVYVSDRDDGGSNLALDAFAQLVVAAAGDPRRAMIAGASGPQGGNCFDGGRQGFASPRLVGLARDNGGIAYPICVPTWGAQLAQESLPLLGHRRRFGLPTTPEPSSVRVFEDGVEVPPLDGVNWRLANGHVEFAPGAVPQPAQYLEIQYQPACAP